MNRHPEQPERTTLVLTREINCWLDAQCAAMRLKTGTSMSRSELLRAIVRATADLAQADFSECRTEYDIGCMMFLGELDQPATPGGKYELPHGNRCAVA
jgi:hypothetical protein